MADINIEKKRRSPLPLILGVLALALLAFLLMRSCADDEPEAVEGAMVDTTTSMTPAPTSAAPMPAAPMDGAAGAAGVAGAAGAGWIGGVLAGTSTGGTASGEGSVPSTPSDRGFWIEENGQRVFAILAEPMEQMKDVDPGQRVRISNAQVLAGSDQARIPADVDAEAKQTASGQSYFLLVPSSGVEIVAGGNTTVD